MMVRNTPFALVAAVSIVGALSTDHVLLTTPHAADNSINYSVTINGTVVSIWGHNFTDGNKNIGAASGFKILVLRS